MFASTSAEIEEPKLGVSPTASWIHETIVRTKEYAPVLEELKNASKSSGLPIDASELIIAVRTLTRRRMRAVRDDGDEQVHSANFDLATILNLVQAVANAIDIARAGSVVVDEYSGDSLRWKAFGAMVEEGLCDPTLVKHLRIVSFEEGDENNNDVNDVDASSTNLNIKDEIELQAKMGSYIGMTCSAKALDIYMGAVKNWATQIETAVIASSTKKLSDSEKESNAAMEREAQAFVRSVRRVCTPAIDNFSVTAPLFIARYSTLSSFTQNIFRREAVAHGLNLPFVRTQLINHIKELADQIVQGNFINGWNLRRAMSCFRTDAKENIIENYAMLLSLWLATDALARIEVFISTENADKYSANPFRYVAERLKQICGGKQAVRMTLVKACAVTTVTLKKVMTMLNERTSSTCFQLIKILIASISISVSNNIELSIPLILEICKDVYKRLGKNSPVQGFSNAEGVIWALFNAVVANSPEQTIMAFDVFDMASFGSLLNRIDLRGTSLCGVVAALNALFDPDQLGSNDSKTSKSIEAAMFMIMRLGVGSKDVQNSSVDVHKFFDEVYPTLSENVREEVLAVFNAVSEKWMKDVPRETLEIILEAEKEIESKEDDDDENEDDENDDEESDEDEDDDEESDDEDEDDDEDDDDEDDDDEDDDDEDDDDEDDDDEDDDDEDDDDEEEDDDDEGNPENPETFYPSASYTPSRIAAIEEGRYA